jgi:hypothetical protein
MRRFAGPGSVLRLVLRLGSVSLRPVRRSHDRPARTVTPSARRATRRASTYSWYTASIASPARLRRLAVVGALSDSMESTGIQQLPPAAKTPESLLNDGTGRPSAQEDMSA